MKIECTYFKYSDDECFAELTIKKWFELKTVKESWECYSPDDFYYCWFNSETGDYLFRTDERWKILDNALGLAQFKHDKEVINK